jgi:hypothetical protein
MLILYGRSDCHGWPGAGGKSGLDDDVVMCQHVRTKAAMHTAFTKPAMEDAEPKPKDKRWVLRHHVPYHRIFVAIEDGILFRVKGGFSLTRREVLQWLIDARVLDSKSPAWTPLKDKTGKDIAPVLTQLAIEPDEQLIAIGSPLASQRAYNAWVDWAVSAICYWPQNLFSGPGTGDQNGFAIDNPTGTKKGDQIPRVAAARKVLQEQILPWMPRDEVLKNVEKSEYKMTPAEEKEDAAMLLKQREVALTKEELDFAANFEVWGADVADSTRGDDPDYTLD